MATRCSGSITIYDTTLECEDFADHAGPCCAFEYAWSAGVKLLVRLIWTDARLVPRPVEAVSPSSAE